MGELPGTIEVEGAGLPWPEGGEAAAFRIRLKNTGFARWLAGERGPGGVAVVVKLFVDEGLQRDLLAGRPWLALPRDLAHGGGDRLGNRRPPARLGPPTCGSSPTFSAAWGFSKLGGPLWEMPV